MKFCSGIKLFLGDPETKNKFRPYVLNLTRWWLDSNCDQVIFPSSTGFQNDNKIALADWLMSPKSECDLPRSLSNQKTFIND